MYFALFLSCFYVYTYRKVLRVKHTVVHDDVIKWKHFPRYSPFVRGIHRSPVNSPHKGQWRGALMFSLICAWIYGWVNNRAAGDLRRHRTHYDVTVMRCPKNMNQDDVIKWKHFSPYWPFFQWYCIFDWKYGLLPIFDNIACYRSVIYQDIERWYVLKTTFLRFDDQEWMTVKTFLFDLNYNWNFNEEGLFGSEITQYSLLFFYHDWIYHDFTFSTIRHQDICNQEVDLVWSTQIRGGPTYWLAAE